FIVKIPDNFFTLVANQHSEEKIATETKLELDYPKTDLLFYNHILNLPEFKGEVLDVIEKTSSEKENTSEIAIILDKTAFYPEGGGQPSDIGYLIIEGENYEVKHTEKVGDVVLHKIVSDRGIDYFKNNIKLMGKTVNGIIDWDRRIALARNHTATHLIIAASKRVLGNHIWQSGAQKGLKHSRLDLSHYKRISQEELNEIERIANELVMENIALDIKWMNRDEADKEYGFTLYQGGVVPGSVIRVINIPGVDVQACAGTHVSNTGDIGLIKINKTERIQDGVERLDFSAGIAAVQSMQTNDEHLRDSSDIFKVTAEQLPKTCDRFFNEWKAQKNEIDKLKSEIAKLKISSLTDNLDEINRLKVLRQVINGDIKELQNIATDFTDNGKADIAIIGNNEGKIVGAASKVAIDKGIKINEIIKESASVLGGGGGGRLTLAQGAGPKADKIEEALELALELLAN
ncbi:MAG: DHHA1 domain-containing protein, partial [Methanobrevibacter sp.]|nr:DHHA1 domain-containing protein [Methanobrevibacter sp.]